MAEWFDLYGRCGGDLSSRSWLGRVSGSVSKGCGQLQRTWHYLFPCMPVLLCCICSAGFRSLGAVESAARYKVENIVGMNIMVKCGGRNAREKG